MKLFLNHDELKYQLYRVSTDFDSCNISQVPMYIQNINFCITITEICFTFLAIIVGVPWFYALLTTTSTLFPRRIRPYVFFAMFAASLRFITRMYLLFDAAFAVSDDISVGGPLGFLHYFKISMYFLMSLTLNGITFECVLSTIDPLKYERDKSVGSFYYITTFNIGVAFVLVPTTYMRFISPVICASIVFISSGIDLICLIIVYRKNKAYLKHYYNISLAERFQVKQNIEISMSLVPILIPTLAIMSFLSGCIIAFSHMNRDKCIRSVLMTAVNCGTAFYCVICPIMQFATWPRLWNAVVCKKSGSSLVAPQMDHTEIYFTELTNQWNLRLK